MTRLSVYSVFIVLVCSLVSVNAASRVARSPHLGPGIGIGAGIGGAGIGLGVPGAGFGRPAYGPGYGGAGLRPKYNPGFAPGYNRPGFGGPGLGGPGYGGPSFSVSKSESISFGSGGQAQSSASSGARGK